MTSLLERYTNKRISFKFAGVSLELDLSQGLFSSFAVDAGTKLLLKAVAQKADLKTASRVADVGCGTGVIGIALLKANHGCSCVFQDRDALALAFARSNCLLNGVEKRARFIGGLGLQAAGGSSFDLILSNLPAKAGLPVLSQIVTQMLTQLEPKGVAAVVVVATLADEIGGILHRLSTEILHTEARREHRVYLFRRSADAEALLAGHFAAYLKGRTAFTHGRISYDLDTAYNLPDFDTLGWETSLAMDLIDRRLNAAWFDSCADQVLIWNPGQGHAAVYLSKRFQNLQACRFILASRDALSLEATRRNLASLPGSVETPASFHVASMDALCGEAAAFSKKVDLAVLFLQPVPGAGWEDEAALLVDLMLSPGGTLVASAGSTVIHRFLSVLHGMVLQGSRKYHGSRSVILKKTV